jgi:glycosyltransferase involved in cell wall biosynthesis
MLLRGLDRSEFQQRLYLGVCEHGESEAGIDAEASLCRSPALRRRVAPWSEVQSFNHLRKELGHFGPRIVHSHTAKAGVLARLSTKRSSAITLVHTFHGFNFTGHLWLGSGTLSRLVERVLAARTDALVVQAEGQREQLCAVLPSKLHRRCVVIPPAVDEAFLVAPESDRLFMRGRLGIDPSAYVLLFAGRLAPVKRPALLLEVMAALRSDPSVHLLIVGEGPLATAFHRRMKEMDLSRRITVLSPQPELWKFMDAADALVLLSRSEGTPLVLLEAQARGLPVLSTDVGSARELLAPGQSLVDAGAGAAAMAAAVRHLQSTRRRNDHLAQDARTWVANAFRESALTGRISDLYRSLLG